MHHYNSHARPTRRGSHAERPRPQKPKKSAGFKVLIALLTLLVFLVSGTGVFVLFGGLGAFQKAEPGFQTQDEVRALRLAAPAAGSDEAALRSYYASAIAFAAQNGFNTLLFEAKQDLTVQWRDNIFPTAPETEAQDGFFYKLDPLKILCEELGGASLQLWLEVDPFATGGASGGGSKAEKLLAKKGGAFTADDAEYADLLIQSLSGVSTKYSIAGIVLSGFAGGAESESANTAYINALGTTLSGLKSALDQKERPMPLGLSFDTASTRLQPALLGGLLSQGAVSYLLPQVTAAQNAAVLAAYSLPGAGLIAVQPAQYDGGRFLFAARQVPGYAGALLAAYPGSQNDTANIGTLRSVLTAVDAPLPTGFTVPGTLAVTWPDQGATITYDTTATDELFVMGTSDPTLPLYAGGAEVTVRAENGMFGVAVPLVVGENSYTFTQGDQSATLTVTRPAPSTGGGGGATPEGAVPEAAKGQAVQVTSLIASVLIDPHNDLSPSLNETLHRGATFIVEESVRTVRWNAENGRNERIWAYKMKSGEYVLGTNCTFVDSGVSSFSGIAATGDDGGEWLDFQGMGAPAAYVAYESEDSTLRLTFYDTDFTLPEGFQSRFVTGASVAREGDATILILQTNGLWGYNLEYSGGTTRLYLKAPPTRGADPARPLEGVRIMLDPGHGDTDRGALGVMGSTGPNEKDMNLALAQAIGYRLRQMGATVLMTRDGDSLPTLQDRLEMQMTQKPDFFLSVHHNSVNLDRDRNDVFGLEAYYYHPYSTPSSQQFAQNVLDAVAPATGRIARREGAAGWGAYYVTRTTVCPSVLFEYGFVVNPLELEDLLSEAGICNAAFATAEAILASIPA